MKAVFKTMIAGNREPAGQHRDSKRRTMKIIVL